MAAYRPGDYYVSSSGMVMQWDGTSWKSKGQSQAPGGQDAIKNGRPATAPGAARNPVVAEETGLIKLTNALAHAQPKLPPVFRFVFSWLKPITLTEALILLSCGAL